MRFERYFQAVRVRTLGKVLNIIYGSCGARFKAECLNAKEDRLRIHHFPKTRKINKTTIKTPRNLD